MRIKGLKAVYPHFF